MGSVACFTHACVGMLSSVASSTICFQCNAGVLEAYSCLMEAGISCFHADFCPRAASQSTVTAFILHLHAYWLIECQTRPSHLTKIGRWWLASCCLQFALLPRGSHRCTAA